MIHIFMQARMSSRRFPGKMMALFEGTPLVKVVLRKLEKVEGISSVVVLTSDEDSDDPLAEYLRDEGDKVFRGDLENVFKRFQQALAVNPCDYFVRICGDSPMIDPALVTFMVKQAVTGNYDFLSNVQCQKFPKGQSVEIIWADVFQAIDPEALTEDQREHVMPYFYEHAQDYKTYFPDYGENLRSLNFCVDTKEDLERLQSVDLSFSFDEEKIC